jgi:hypothetical protein
MTDKKLLELAAKAAGMQIVGEVDKMICQPDHTTGGFVIRNDRGGDSCWNPLTDDGDALRLAVKLNIDLRFYPNPQIAEPWVEAATENDASDELLQPDPFAATRRAIVRAAAEIGKTMENQNV